MVSFYFPSTRVCLCLSLSFWHSIEPAEQLWSRKIDNLLSKMIYFVGFGSQTGGKHCLCLRTASVCRIFFLLSPTFLSLSPPFSPEKTIFAFTTRQDLESERKGEE